jgi:hypothetical protein
VVSHPEDNSGPADVHFIGGRLKVVTERDFSAKVPFEMSDGKFSYEDAPNPINQMGALLADQVPVVTSNDFESFLAAFSKRSNFVQQGPEDDVDPDCFNEALNVINSIPDQDFPIWEETPEDIEAWLNTFDKGKRARMIAAADLISQVEAFELGKKDLSVKLEVLLKRDDPSWAPRIIYAGTDAMNRVTGPAMKEFMRRLMLCVSKHRVGPCEVKLAYKTNDVDLCAFLAGQEPSDAPTPSAKDLPDGLLKGTYEGDFSANDKEQRSRVAYIFDAWLAKLRMPMWLRTLFLEMEKFTVYNRRFGVKATLKYQLPTGTTATTGRNSCYNMTMFAVAARRQRIKFARIVVLGDDILARTSCPFCISKWKQVVDLFKMKLKGKQPALNGQATLLSRRLIFDTETPCMLPLIGKALARFNARASLNEAVSDSHYMAGKALSYAYEFRHVPQIRDAFLERYEMEDHSKVTLDDLTWFTRTSGYDSVEKLERMIRNERVLVDEYDWERWLMETYELAVDDLSEILALVVLNRNCVLVEHPEIAKLAIDW